jgi:hypothetical protein
MAQETQTLKNHTRLDPSFHFFLAPLALALFITAVVNVIRFPSWSAAAHMVAAIWALVATFKIRLYSLKVQDRVIRLEERLRFKETLPPALQARAGELTAGQCVALRFASDGELPQLVEKALAGKWKSRQIKESVQTWRPDYFRV